MSERYQLRHAAGCYWLLDMEQSGKDYIGPIVLNESGAEIWNRLQAGGTIDQVAEEFPAAAEAGNERMDGVGGKWIFYWWAAVIIS